MNSIALLQRLREKASSDRGKSEERKAKKRLNTNQRTLEFDLFAQLSYMAAISTAGVPRAKLFEYAAELPYVSSSYFKRINIVARKLNLDYAEACRMEAERTRSPELRSLLLRMSGSLSSGEDETKFLRREAETVAEVYGNKYGREVEALKKWTDAYVALVVAASLIVIVAVISMMIYQVGVIFIVGLALAMVAVSCVGAWTIYVSAPREIKTRVSGPSSSLQRLADKLFKVLALLAIVIGGAMLMMGLDLAWVLIGAGAVIFPVGFLATRDDKNVTRKDDDIATVVRVLGGVASAMSTTVADALGRIDRRSMGSLTPEVDRLRMRLKAGIDPSLCWETLVDETGSELVERTVHMFWDPINAGGEPGKVGEAAAFFCSRIAFLRASRQLVAATFSWLALPLHVALVALLEFILEIMGLFTLDTVTGISNIAEESSAIAETSLPIADLFTFGQVNLDLVGVLVTSVVLVLTFGNAFAPKAADGGHSYKFVYNLAITMMISGFLMLAVPRFASSIFQSILEGGA